MKFYYIPGFCSLGIHILLEEASASYEECVLSAENNRHRQNQEFMALTHKGKVPLLRLDDQTALTEYPAIAFYIAHKYPKARLLPADPEQEAKALSSLFYISERLHAVGFHALFFPEEITPIAANQTQIKAETMVALLLGFAHVNSLLAGKEWLAGSYSVADSALFYVSLWAKHHEIPLPSECRRHFEQMLQRKAVQRVLQKEGLSV